MKQTLTPLLVILITSSISKALTTSKEYCESNQCDGDYDGFDANLTNEEAVQQYIERYGLDRLEHFIKARLDLNRNIQLKIAVTGESGSGKSTLINTFRGLRPSDVGAALTGVTEITSEIQRYSSPKQRKLKFYDLPGVGTPNFPKESYLEKVQYQKYDFFIIVSGKKFTENDLWLSQMAKKSGKGFLFVRSRVNEDLVNEKRDHPMTFNETKVLDKIRANCLKHISAIDPTANVFVISGLLEDTDKFDYGLMEKTLIESFPNYKRQALIASMTFTSKEGIQAKVKVLRSQAWMIGILSGGVGAIPVPGVPFLLDFVLISQTISSYKNQLGLDDQSLQRIAKRADLSLDELKEILMGGWEGGLFANDIKNYVGRLILKYGMENAAKELCQHIPVVGVGLAVVKTAQTTMAILNNSLDQMLNASLLIIDLIK